MTGGETGVTDRQEEALRREPAARVHHDVQQTAGLGVDDEPIDGAEFAFIKAMDVQIVEVRVVEPAQPTDRSRQAPR